MARKKRKHTPAMSILIFVTTLVIVTTFIYLRGKKRHKVSDISRYTNSSIYTYQNVKIRDSRRNLLSYSFRKKKLADAMWTMKPNIPNQWKFADNIQSFDISDQSKSSRDKGDEDTSDDDVRFSPETDSDETDSKSSSNFYETTPSVTEAPTTPITTQSETTPMYTEAPTSPITTEAITTPGVTEAGEIEATTEIDPDSDPNETLLLIRQRRGSFGFTPTSPDPLTTSVAPPECGGNQDYTNDSENFYKGPTGDCECGYNMTGPYCSEDVTREELARRLASSLQYNTVADGEYDNTRRPAFQQQLEQHYASLPGFQRVFVLPLTYDPVTNKTSVNFIVFFDETTDGDDASGSAGKTLDIVGSILPILIDNQPVTFGENDSNLIRRTIDGEEQTVPLGAQSRDNGCYIYEQLQTCDHGENRGECVLQNGVPMCKCTTSWVGEFCEEAVRYAPAGEAENILPILLPVLAAVGVAAALCSCCFLCCRRCNKAADETSSFSESLVESPPLILPRYYPFASKQFIAGAEPEDLGVSNLVIERPIIQPVIVERTIVKERPVKTVVQDVVVPVVHDVPVTRNILTTTREDLRPFIRENGGNGWESGSSDGSTAITSPSMILPRFYPTPYKQFIPGSEGDEEEITIKKWY